jgi:hypothetical protein
MCLGELHLMCGDSWLNGICNSPGVCTDTARMSSSRLPPWLIELHVLCRFVHHDHWLSSRGLTSTCFHTMLCMISRNLYEIYFSGGSHPRDHRSDRTFFWFAHIFFDSLILVCPNNHKVHVAECRMRTAAGSFRYNGTKGIGPPLTGWPPQWYATRYGTARSDLLRPRACRTT